MKRRFFVNALSGLLLVTNLAKQSDSSREINSNGFVENSNQPITLLPGSTYELPSSPGHFETLYFTPGVNDWKQKPPVIRSANKLIMGKNEPILADTNISFGLKYIDEKAGWVFFQFS